MKELQISLGNCDLITVDGRNVKLLLMYGVDKIYQLTSKDSIEMNTVNNVKLILSKDADLSHKELGLLEFATTVFKRLTNTRDIVSLNIVHEDGREKEFYVSYEEDEYGRYNELELTEIDSEGNLVIKIGKDVCSW